MTEEYKMCRLQPRNGAETPPVSVVSTARFLDVPSYVQFECALKGSQRYDLQYFEIFRRPRRLVLSLEIGHIAKTSDFQFCRLYLDRALTWKKSIAKVFARML